jgi:hypothetical protein
MKQLRVLSRAGIIVLDVVHAQQTGARRYVGRKTITAWKEDELPPGEPSHIQSNTFLEPGDKPIPHTAYPRISTPSVVPADRYFIKAIKNGELWAADEETARICGVAFDPTFGGDHPSLTKPSKAAKAGE